ncbi:Probable ATP-binding cassette sub-family F member 3 homolog [Seminavis robusta]|uniref:Probable ATP-binding cassette sub-family F member 3 homolog n=1 Tax=Seminavis robusta TaxID=568900 RepID=A0A9N8DM67_9STRA|nr:Probable ATP-binding cassette sub-family F member 3 homolog [Seminavis robusta]|eukprot:Sro156_g070740.1 Probable ATP-binding cassette sub-family F member 3 homolog (605) ;mRNA; r:29695-31509
MVNDDNNNNSNNATDGLATFSTSAPCSYHRGHAISISGLSLSHDGGRTLFQSTDLSLPHGSITGIVGTNGAGKSSLAQVLASKTLDGFPSDLTVEYLAAADDEDGHHEEDADSSLNLYPRDYIQSRLQGRLDQLRQTIEEMEAVMEEAVVEEVERISEELSDLYDTEEVMAESLERETDQAMERVGLKAHARKKLDQLSCGWRYKCRLIAAVLTHPACLIIDEPSFLDRTSTEWLMEQLQHLAKTDRSIVLLISHKETLLDALCDRIMHINSANQTLTTYNCGYTAFRHTLESEIQHTTKSIEQSQDNLETADKSLKKVQAVLKKREGNFRNDIKHGEDQRFIKGKNKEAKQKADKSAASKLKKAQQVVKDAEQIKHKAKRERVKPLHIDGVPAAEGTIITLQDVGVRYDGDWVFQNVDTSLEANDRVLLQGANGCGKTTLVKLILGELEPTEGSVHRSTQNILYFPQTALHQLLRQHGSQTALEFLQPAKTMTETQARHHLGDLGLAKDLALHHVKTLSAGQRVRLWLAHQILKHPKPSLLILDEMSENVDVATRKSLTEMLETFQGAVLVISHDPDFRDSFAKGMTKTWKLWRHGLEVAYPE